MVHRDTSFDEPGGARVARLEEPERQQRPALRIGDAERGQAIDDLGAHLSAGRLALDEYEQRLDLVVGAKTAADLHPVFEDLPPVAPAPVAAAPGVAAAAAAAAAALAAHRSADPHRPHRRRPDRRRRPVVAWALAGPWLMVNALMVFIWAATGAGYFWPVWVIGPWGLAILPAVMGSRRRSGRPRDDRWEGTWR